MQIKSEHGGQQIYDRLWRKKELMFQANDHSSELSHPMQICMTIFYKMHQWIEKDVYILKSNANRNVYYVLKTNNYWMVTLTLSKMV